MSPIITITANTESKLNGAIVNLHPDDITLYLTGHPGNPFHTPDTWKNRDKTNTWILMLRRDHGDDDMVELGENTASLRKELIDVVQEVDVVRNMAEEGQIEDVHYRKMNLRAFKFPITKDYNGFDPRLAEMAAALLINYQSLMKIVKAHSG